MPIWKISIAIITLVTIILLYYSPRYPKKYDPHDFGDVLDSAFAGLVKILIMGGAIIATLTVLAIQGCVGW